MLRVIGNIDPAIVYIGLPRVVPNDPPTGIAATNLEMEIGTIIDESRLYNRVFISCAGDKGDGNPSTDEVSYLGAAQYCVTVGAIDQNKKPASFTNSNTWIDLMAPGVDITSTWPGGGYKTLSGTSMAAAYVAGATALIYQYTRSEFNTRLSEADIYAQLIKPTVYLPNIPRTIQGNGMLYLPSPIITPKS